jgi:stage V sporulation protein SpoVS
LLLYTEKEERKESEERDMNSLKVSSKSSANSVAGALAAAIREDGAAELQAVGAGAVTKLMKNQSFGKPEKIERIFSPKYPYEYLRDARTIREGDPEKGIPSLHDKILSFYRNDR